MKRANLPRFIAGAALLGAGMVAGTAFHTSNEALGEVRGAPPPATFQTGGQLSVPVLKEIAATLHQIDARLGRLEIAAQKLQTPRPVSPGGN